MSVCLSKFSDMTNMLSEVTSLNSPYMHAEFFVIYKENLNGNASFLASVHTCLLLATTSVTIAIEFLNSFYKF